MTKPTPHTRDAYPHHLTIPTRWADADRYGHVNNSVYYFYFDTVVNRWLVEAGLLALENPERIGLVVETACNFFAPIDFPQDVTAGLRVARIGSSSVRFEIALFTDGDSACAQGHFVHVYVDADTRRPLPIPDTMREALGTLTV